MSRDEANRRGWLLMWISRIEPCIGCTTARDVLRRVKYLVGYVGLPESIWLAIEKDVLLGSHAVAVSSVEAKRRAMNAVIGEHP